jgi:hypothetical protein
MAYTFWTVFPFILWCIGSENKRRNIENFEVNNNYDEGQWKYFCYRMWLPQNATQTPIYQFIYLYQALENSMVILIHTVHNMLTFSLMLHLISQFKVLTLCLERIEDIPSLTLEEMRTPNDEIASNYHCDIGTQNISTPYRYGVSKENTTHRNTIQYKDNDGWIEMDTLGLLHIPRDDEMHRYLVNCVKYHQRLLQ